MVTSRSLGYHGDKRETSDSMTVRMTLPRMPRTVPGRFKQDSVLTPDSTERLLSGLELTCSVSSAENAALRTSLDCFDDTWYVAPDDEIGVR